MSFLPENYEQIAPSEITGRYTKFEIGETRIRPVSSVRIGWEWWSDDNKPHRVEGGTDVRPQNVPARTNKFGNADINFFWVFKAYNSGTEQIELCQIRQASVRKPIQQLATDPDWGDPSDVNTGYGLKIIREQKGEKTEYNVTPGKPSPLTEKIMDAMDKQPVNIDAFFSGDNPFESNAASTTNYDAIAF